MNGIYALLRTGMDRVIDALGGLRRLLASSRKARLLYIHKNKFSRKAKITFVSNTFHRGWRGQCVVDKE